MSPKTALLPVLVLCAVLGIAIVQPALAKNVHLVHQRDDAFLLPPPEQLRVMTFGYRAATTDLLWAKLILEFGVHHVEKRPFPDITRYLDAIIAIEPEFPTLYEFVDTLVVYPPPQAAPRPTPASRAAISKKAPARAPTTRNCGCTTANTSRSSARRS